MDNFTTVKNLIHTNHDNQEKIHGIVERVTFHSEETGFCVLRIKAKSHRDLVTVIGNSATIHAGEYIQGQGFWHNDKQHGLQFKATHLQVTTPTSEEGILKYLSSGMIKGIGSHFAKRLIQAFGKEVFDVIENHPLRLSEVDGIGKKRKEQIIKAWGEQKYIREIMVFLQSYGVGTARAVRIYKTYGDHAIAIVKADPYKLALDIRGIGFKSADKIAMQLGIAKDSMLRASAGVRHVLQLLCDKGHCAVPHTELVAESVTLLAIDESIITNAISKEIGSEHIVADLINEIPCVFPASLFQAEVSVAKHIARLSLARLPWHNIDFDKAIPWVEDKTKLALSDSQRKAIACALTHKVSIITGGPGVGKTTVVNSILHIIRAKRIPFMLCAPTGRAAKRLSETTSQAAKTIHRLLEYDPQHHGFAYNQDNPLPTSFLIIDESSMIDIALMNHVLKALPNDCALLLVGDVDQLPSVGPGAVLANCIDSGKIATAKLNKIFRQAASSKIITNAHRVNAGQMPIVHDASDTLSDFYVLYTKAVEDISAKLIDLVKQRIPKRFHFNPLHDIQVLTPMNRGGLGTQSLNLALQAQLNPTPSQKITKFGWTYAPGDKVIQNVNNYDKDIFNGDIGFIEKLDLEEQSLWIDFEGRLIEYAFTELDEISLAYAISIHKSQGSEYPAVVIPLATQHYTLLVRNLLYTAITRGKKLVVLVAQKKAVAIAIHQVDSSKRITKLANRINQLLT